MAVVIETTKGIFTVDLYLQDRPKVCENFLKLCKMKYYNFSLFHSVQRDFLAQTGDPTGTGRGGESIYAKLYGDQAKYFEGDVGARKIRHSKPGLISMVSSGGNLFGSQFFVSLGSDLTYLDEQGHCVFGEITEGLETLEVFNEIICDGENRPFQDVRISHTVILEDPFDDPPGLDPPPNSPLPNADALATDRLPADEDFDDLEGKTQEELAEIAAEKEAKAQATILEMVGDLPDADVAPPENVLFVCKLNPVTTDEDLEIIFSRFGKVVSCEVIRDKKTADSLQYAFIEFESQDACERAYFKMDNVLIDDRRIHVDFSQSVAKFRWKGKGRLEIVDESSTKNDKRSNEDGAQRKPDSGRFKRIENKYNNSREHRNYRDSSKTYREDFKDYQKHGNDHKRNRATSRDRKAGKEHSKSDKRSRDTSRDRRRNNDSFRDRKYKSDRYTSREDSDRKKHKSDERHISSHHRKAEKSKKSRRNSSSSDD